MGRYEKITWILMVIVTFLFLVTFLYIKEESIFSLNINIYNINIFATYNFIIITTIINLIFFLIILCKIFKQRKENEESAFFYGIPDETKQEYTKKTRYLNFENLDFKTKKFFIEKREEWSNQVQILFLTLIPIIISFIAVNYVLGSIIPPEKFTKPIILFYINIIILISYFSFYFWTFYIVRPRVKDLNYSLDALVKGYEKEKKEQELKLKSQEVKEEQTENRPVEKIEEPKQEEKLN